MEPIGSGSGTKFLPVYYQVNCYPNRIHFLLEGIYNEVRIYNNASLLEFLRNHHSTESLGIESSSEVYLHDEFANNSNEWASSTTGSSTIIITGIWHVNTLHSFSRTWRNVIQINGLKAKITGESAVLDRIIRSTQQNGISLLRLSWDCTATTNGGLRYNVQNLLNSSAGHFQEAILVVDFLPQLPVFENLMNQIETKLAAGATLELIVTDRPFNNYLLQQGFQPAANPNLFLFVHQNDVVKAYSVFTRQFAGRTVKIWIPRREL
uniref:Uncharacterized protein n=1 Tax=Panagrolaimus sp. JU765 TaxID=591449 RepID=A0AC34QRR4_9BILA